MGVVVAQLSKHWFKIAICLTLSSGATAQKLVPTTEPELPYVVELAKSLDIKLAKESSPSCHVFATQPSADKIADVKVKEALQKVFQAVEKRGDPKVLQSMFHPRLKMNEDRAFSLLKQMQQIVGKDPQPTVLAVVALHVPSGKPVDIACPALGVEFFPRYGHTLQLMALVQVLGSDEVARLVLGFVPTTDKWALGLWHLQQWSHAGKDPSGWVNTAKEEEKNQHPLAAFLLLDIAKKLLTGGEYLTYNDLRPVEEEQQKIMTKTDWEEQLKKNLAPEKIDGVASLLSRGGAGILLKIRVPGEISLNDTRSRCDTLKNKIKAQSWSKHVAGIRCSFYMPGEALEKEGKLGGLFVPL